MLTYEKLKKEPRRLLALTSLTSEEFDDLLGAFQKSWETDVEKRLNSQTRKRKAGGGRKAALNSLEDKLLFILVYFKHIHCKKRKALCLG